MPPPTEKESRTLDIAIAEYDHKQLTRCAEEPDYLEQLEKEKGIELYTGLIMSLTHQSYPAEKAKQIWLSIVQHLYALNKILERNVGLSVAALDYMSNIIQVMDEPLLLEEDTKEELGTALSLDPLTQLYDRGIFDESLGRILAESEEKGLPVSLLMIDIDDFKLINDKHGHQVGDSVLTAVAKRIKSQVRETDLAARYGGEELVVILPNTLIDKAQHMAERIRKGIEHDEIEGVKVTVSIGIAEGHAPKLHEKILIEEADKALYQAKKKGKNRVVLA